MIGESWWHEAWRTWPHRVALVGVGLGAAFGGLAVYERAAARHDVAVARLATATLVTRLDSLQAMVAERGCVWVRK